MSKRTRLTKSKFHAINRELKDGISVKGTAFAHQVSEETVRTVKRAKTWPRFEEMKRLKNERHRPSAPEAAQQTNLPGVSLAEAVENATESLDKITQAPENQIRREPSDDGVSSPIKIVTVKEWNDLNRKLGALYSLVSRKHRKPLLSIFRRTK